MRTVWVQGVELAEGASGAVTRVPILPIGKFKLDRYPSLDLSEKVAARLVSNFGSRVLKHDIRIDIEHDFREAAGWIRALEVGAFTHPVTGESVPGIIATVEWTPLGEKLLSEQTYRYVSAAFGNYRDEETGKLHRDVLKAVALTNDPAMKMLPPVELSEELAGAEHITLPEIEDRAADARASADTVDAISAILSDFAEQVHGAYLGGGRDAIESLVVELPDELEAVLSDAPMATIDGEKHPASDFAYAPAPFNPSTWKLPIFDEAHVAAAVAALGKGYRGQKVDIPAGDLPAVKDKVRKAWKATHPDEDVPEALLTDETPEGGIQMDETPEDAVLTDEPSIDTELAERAAALEDELTTLKAAQHEERIAAVLAKLSAKGASEPLRQVLERIMRASGSEVRLSDDADAAPADMAEAVEAVADALEVVPTGETSEQEPVTAEPKPGPTEADVHVAGLLNIDPAVMAAVPLPATE